MKKFVVRTATTLLIAAMLLLGSGSHTLQLGPMALRAGGQDEDIVRTPPSNTSGFESSSKYKYSKIKSKIVEAHATNKEVKGWLTIPGTNINEPIPFNSTHNTYYEKRSWQGINYPNNNYSNFVATASYLDFRTKFGETWSKSSKNTVIYGHNWTNLRDPLDIGNVSKHTMFGQLPSYTNMDFAKSNPYIYYSTDELEGIWKVFAVAYCELDESFFYNGPNPAKEKYQTLLNEWKDRTMYDFNVEVDTSDRILTLSTCTRQYNMGAQQRFVVVARLLRDGESENDSVKVSVNEDMKKPKF